VLTRILAARVGSTAANPEDQCDQESDCAHEQDRNSGRASGSIALLCDAEENPNRQPPLDLVRTNQ
jgi:hypothetical protein